MSEAYIDNTTDELVKWFDATASQYQPTDERVTARLRDVKMVPVIGITAVGKTTVMRQLAQNHSDFERVQGFTTRPARPGEPDDLYRFYPHDTEQLVALRAQAIDGRLVQYAVHPTTNHLYGTEVVDYPRPFALKDMLSGAVNQLGSVGFKDVLSVVVVCEPELWRERFQSRQQSVGDQKKRLLEARRSLNWSLDAGNVHFIDNSSTPEAAAKQLVEVCSNPDCSNDSSSDLVIELIDVVEAMINSHPNS